MLTLWEDVGTVEGRRPGFLSSSVALSSKLELETRFLVRFYGILDRSPREGDWGI